jgi:hypothetical protein
MVDKDDRKVLVYEQPTTMRGTPAQVALLHTFVLNNQHQYIWRIVDIRRYDINDDYITYVANGENNQGRVDIVVPRKWSMTMTMRQGDERQ